MLMTIPVRIVNGEELLNAKEPSIIIIPRGQ